MIQTLIAIILMPFALIAAAIKIALAVGAAVTAGSLVLGLSNSRGQQSNAQLYGQQPLSY